MITDLMEKEVFDIFHKVSTVQDKITFQVLPEDEDANYKASALRDMLKDHFEKQHDANIHLLSELENLSSYISQTFLIKFSSEEGLNDTNIKLLNASEILKRLEFSVNQCNQDLRKICENAGIIRMWNNNLEEKDIKELQQIIFKEIQSHTHSSASFVIQEVANKFNLERANLAEQIDNCQEVVQAYYTRSLQNLEECNGSLASNTTTDRGFSDFKLFEDRCKSYQDTISNLETLLESLETQMILLKKTTEESDSKVEFALHSNFGNVQILIDDLEKKKSGLLSLKQDLHKSPTIEVVNSLPSKIKGIKEESQKCLKEIEIMAKTEFNPDVKVLKEIITGFVNQRSATMDEKIKAVKASYTQEIAKYQEETKEMKTSFDLLKSIITSADNNCKKLATNYEKLNEFVFKQLQTLSINSSDNRQNIDQNLKVLGSLESEGAKLYEKDKKACEEKISKVEKSVLELQGKLDSVEKSINSHITSQEKAKNSLELSFSKQIKILDSESENEKNEKWDAEFKFKNFLDRVESYEKKFDKEGGKAWEEMSKKYLLTACKDLNKISDEQDGLTKRAEELEMFAYSFSQVKELFCLNHNNIQFDVMPTITTMVNKAQESIFAETAKWGSEQEKVIMKMENICGMLEGTIRHEMISSSSNQLDQYMETFGLIEEQCRVTLDQVESLVNNAKNARRDIQTSYELFGKESKAESERYQIDFQTTCDFVENTKKELNDFTIMFDNMNRDMIELEKDYDEIFKNQDEVTSRIAYLEAQLTHIIVGGSDSLELNNFSETGTGAGTGILNLVNSREPYLSDGIYDGTNGTEETNLLESQNNYKNTKTSQLEKEKDPSSTIVSDDGYNE